MYNCITHFEKHGDYTKSRTCLSNVLFIRHNFEDNWHVFFTYLSFVVFILINLLKTHGHIRECT